MPSGYEREKDAQYYYDTVYPNFGNFCCCCPCISHEREVDDDGMAIWTTIYFACLCINFFDVTEKGLKIR